jgi:hypothetical protein
MTESLGRPSVMHSQSKFHMDLALEDISKEYLSIFMYLIFSPAEMKATRLSLVALASLCHNHRTIFNTELRGMLEI